MHYFGNLICWLVVLCTFLVSAEEVQQFDNESSTVLIDAKKLLKFSQKANKSDCGENEEYQECGKKCVLSCRYLRSTHEITLSKDDCETSECVKGCFCKKELVRSGDKCVSIAECLFVQNRSDRALKNSTFGETIKSFSVWKRKPAQPCAGAGCTPSKGPTTVHIHNHNHIKVVDDDCQGNHCNEFGDGTSEDGNKTVTIRWGSAEFNIPPNIVYNITIPGIGLFTVSTNGTNSTTTVQQTINVSNNSPNSDTTTTSKTPTTTSTSITTTPSTSGTPTTTSTYTTTTPSTSGSSTTQSTESTSSSAQNTTSTSTSTQSITSTSLSTQSTTSTSLSTQSTTSTSSSTQSTTSTSLSTQSTTSTTSTSSTTLQNAGPFVDLTATSSSTTTTPASTGPDLTVDQTDAPDTMETTITIDVDLTGDTTSSKPESTSGKPESTSSKPESTSSKPESTSSKPESTSIITLEFPLTDPVDKNSSNDDANKGGDDLSFTIDGQKKIAISNATESRTTTTAAPIKIPTKSKRPSKLRPTRKSTSKNENKFRSAPIASFSHLNRDKPEPASTV
ncbi:cell wall protein DAN4-like [Contarinia nasturtii]|uniref:cell wall protein DAN4-like n=1 Tax=Contarinia nasturtii TaxID=265458 RepID=UPI0012D4B5A1|nr:cell wall protein DAN4-like [Contarinia nasturtii]